MIGNKSGVIIGAMNLVALGTAVQASQISNLHASDKKVEQVNTASLKSIESTWIKVPVACKARHFNASPVLLEVKEMASHILSIYSVYPA